HRASRDAEAVLIKRYVQSQSGVFMTKHIREPDGIAHHDGGGVFLLVAPETPADEAAGMLTRLSHQVEEHLGLRFRYSIADFPKMALTSEELLEQATDELRHQTKASTDRRAQPPPARATASHDT